jgi:bloom syndrome protein
MQSVAPPEPGQYDFDDHFDNSDDDYDEEQLIEQARRDSRNRALSRREPSTISIRTDKAKSSTPGLSLGRTRLSLENQELMQHPWSSDVAKKLLKTFKLKGFRPNQLEAINATLAGKDVFVLMPTGGGKSLCYQLPSLIDSGKTRGVTLVVSPLLSLMEDQIAHLEELGIQAKVLNGETTPDHKRLIMNALRGPTPALFIRMLYVTPEMLSKNQLMVHEFEKLHKRNLLARIIIDEAHCVSQWGHDFRPEYKSLGNTRKRFPGVPVMALTATATENVKVDVIYQLNMTNCEQFKQSFNRPNLNYEVRPKQKCLDVDIAEIIKKSYVGKSGIIYCLSRNSCESLATKLREAHQIEAHHYHAGMESSEKRRVQARWQSGRYQVIVATIAFGMGIDKADVRFVVHYNMPKSLEGYYQETGRAGRDGERSGCYLFFNYGDVYSYRRMIEKGDGSADQKARQLEMVTKVVQFCDNRSDCRRQHVLQYFNEPYSKEKCKGTCDNCRSKAIFRTIDYTTMAQTAVSLVLSLEPKDRRQGYSHSSNTFTKATLIQLMDIFRGAKSAKVREMKWDQNKYFGAGKAMQREDVERLFHHLVADGAIVETTKMNHRKFPIEFAQVRTSGGIKQRT